MTAIAAFFARYISTFKYDPSAFPTDEFNRLSSLKPNWTSKPVRRKRAWQNYCLALAADNAASDDPVAKYFSQFPDFDYDARRVGHGGVTWESEFARLAQQRKWRVQGRKHGIRKRQFGRACAAAKAGAVPTDVAETPVPAKAEGAGNAVVEDQGGDAGVAKVEPQPAELQIPESAVVRGEVKVNGANTASGQALHGDVGEHSAPPAEPPQQDTVHEELLPEEQPKPIVFKPSSGSGPLDDFFRSFHDFKYEPSAPSEAEFERLRQHRTWNPRKKTYKKQRNAFMRATRDELHWHLERDDILLPRVEEGEEGEDGDGGSDDGEGVSQQDEDALKIMEQHVKPWKRLCEVLDLRMEGGRRRPVTEEDCKEVLSDVFINIFDFIFHLRHGSGTLRRFRDVKALSDYSYNSSPIKVFPKHAALQSPVLKFLLQPIGIARTGTGKAPAAPRKPKAKAKANSGADKGKGKKKEVDLDDVPELGDEQESGGVRLTTPMQLTEEALGQLEEEMAGNSKVEEMLARAVSEELAQKLE